MSSSTEDFWPLGRFLYGASPHRCKKALDGGRDSGYKINMLLCNLYCAVQKSGDPRGLPMFFDETAQSLVSEAPAVGLFRPADKERRAVSVAVPSARLAIRANEINKSRLKRALDIVGAVGLLVVLVPILLMVAVAVKLESKGPVLFRQKRYGVGRDIFTLYKFRSMKVMETHGAFKQVSAGDARITRVGAFLRRTSLDELPQLFNVIKGDMSLVGPRPHAVPMDDTFGRILPNYADRHLVRPGLTGLAQIEGHRGPTDAMNKIQMRLRCDRAYIRKWTPLYDVKILLLTPASLLHANAF